MQQWKGLGWSQSFVKIFKQRLSYHLVGDFRTRIHTKEKNQALVRSQHWRQCSYAWVSPILRYSNYNIELVQMRSLNSFKKPRCHSGPTQEFSNGGVGHKAPWKAHRIKGKETYLPLTSQVTVSISFNLSEPQFLQLRDGGSNSFLTLNMWGSIQFCKNVNSSQIEIKIKWNFSPKSQQFFSWNLTVSFKNLKWIKCQKLNQFVLT